MVKNSEELTEKTTMADAKVESKPTTSRWGIVVAGILAAAVLGSGWYLYKNPQILAKFMPKDTQLTDNLNRLQMQVNALQQEITDLRLAQESNISSHQLTEMREQVEHISRMNMEVLNSKASNAAVLGVVARVDDLENKTRALGKVTNQSALILTAAMFVKESAMGGRPFEYEAALLRHLAAGTIVESPAITISEYAEKGVLCPKKLIAEFNKLYADRMVVDEIKTVEETPIAELTDWKAKINATLSKLVVVEYNADGKEEVIVAESEMPEDKVYQLVNTGDLLTASDLMSDNPDYQTPQFKQWLEQVKARVDFDYAMKRILALTLGAMKAESLQQ